MFFSCRHLPRLLVTYYFSLMNKKQILVIMLVICACSGVYAMSADDIVNKAVSGSITIRTLEINRENTILSRQIDDAEEGVSVTVSSGDVTVRKENTDTVKALRSPAFELSPYAEVVLPEHDDTTVSFKLQDSTKIYKDGDTSTTLTPSASYRQIVSLDSFTDSRKDVTKRMNQLKQDISYQKSVLQFKNSVLQNMVLILQTQSSIISQETTYNRLVSDYDTNIASGDITKDGLKDLQARMKIESARVALENSRTKLSKQLQSFRDSFGFDFETPDSVRDAVLEFEEQKYGNTEVLLAELALNLANQEVEIATGTTNKLTLGANASVPVTMKKDSSVTAEVDASVSGTITGSNYSVGARAGGTYNAYNDNEIYPYITLTGTWHNKTTVTTDDLNVQTLKNKVTLAQIDYDNTLSDYRDECANLRTSIEEHLTDVDQLEVSADYDLKILERVREMYDIGLVTGRDVEDAQIAVDSDNIQKMILAINALIIENNIAINQL